MSGTARARLGLWDRLPKLQFNPSSCLKNGVFRGVCVLAHSNLTQKWFQILTKHDEYISKPPKNTI